MRCPACEKDNPADSSFCGSCGTRLAAACAACGAALPPLSRFCNMCGAPVAAPVRPAPGGRFAEPAAYTPKHLADRILSSRGALEGERKQVTVLFADLRGSLELLAERDPEEARALLDPVVELMMDAVHRYEGTVNQVMGDGIMAIFGAPLAHEDHAARACYAALAMQSAARRHAEALRRSSGITVQIRVGLNSGEVVVRAIGNDLALDYSAIGAATHLASRMEQLAAPGSTLLTADTYRLAEALIEVRPLGAIPVKGLAQPAEVFELVGAAPGRARWGGAGFAGPSRFVGRERELDVLGAALERAGGGRGQVVALVGDAGVGKSRLLRELVHSPRTAGWLVIETGSVPYGASTPYLPVIDLLGRHLHVDSREAPTEVLDKVAARLRALGLSPEPALPALLALLDVPPGDPAWEVLDPPQRRQAILAAVTALLVRESRVQPLCLVVEDLQGIDSETQALLDGLVGHLASERILLLVSQRGGHELGWHVHSHFTELPVEALPPEGARALLRALLGGHAGLAALTALLVERADGNPFFLEQCVRTLAETGALRGEPGDYRPAKPVDTIQIPPTVQAVVAARIDRLAPAAKHLLQTAAVVGRDVPETLLREIAGLGEDELRRSVAQLADAGRLGLARAFPERELAVRNALAHEVAYQSLLHERRRALHARIVDAIERVYAGRLADQVDRLAHHAVRGERWPAAVAYCRQAGTRAFARSVPRVAKGRFEQALEALGHLPESREALGQAIDIRIELRYCLLPLGDFGRIMDELSTAERLAERLGDQRRLGTVSAFLSNFFTVMGDLSRGVEYGERGAAIARTDGDLSLRILASSALAMAHYRLGHFPRAVELARANVAALPGALGRERFGMAPLSGVYARTILAWALSEQGDFAAAGATADEGVRIAEEANHAHSICFAGQAAGVVALRRGDFARAIAVLERALALCESADVPLLFALIASPLAMSLEQVGRAGEAVALLERAIARAVAIGDPFGHWLRTGGLAEALMHAGQTAEALPLARRAVQTTRYIKTRSGEASALWLLGEVARRQPELEGDESVSSLRGALAIAEELGMRPLAAHAHLSLARLYRRTGAAAAAESLAAAAALYRSLDMPAWIEEAERLGRT